MTDPAANPGTPSGAWSAIEQQIRRRAEDLVGRLARRIRAETLREAAAKIDHDVAVIEANVALGLPYEAHAAEHRNFAGWLRQQAAAIERDDP